MSDLKVLTLSPIKSKPRAYEFVAFDTEGDGSLHGFKLAATWDDQGGHVFRRKKDLRDYLFSHRNRDRRLVAANLEYDWAVAFQPFDDHHSILLDGGRWLRASYSDGDAHSWTAWDIQRIAPLSVRDMGTVVGLPKFPTPPSLVDDAHHHREHFTCADHHRTDCVECYCLRDSQIVYEFARLYQAELNDLGGQLKMTAGSCTMDLFKRSFLDEEIEPTFTAKNTWARRSLFGGRVENFKAGTDNFINAYDYNSLYPSVMRDLAVGRPSTYHHLNHSDRLAQRLDGVGLVSATVDVPADYVPVLPTRIHGHNYFVSGRVSGTWTFSELRYALEHGARVVESGELIFADEVIYPFRGFVDTLYARKTSYRDQHDPRETVIKLLLNSLWGKFAQRSDSDLTQLLAPSGKYQLRDYAGCEPAMLAGREVFLKPIESRVQSPHVHVPWACEITAQARIKLHAALEQADAHLYYCDTDSVHTDRDLATGDGLGELKLVDRFQRVTYLAPKEYAAINLKGEFVGHAKGIPPDQQAEFLKRGHVRFKRPLHVLEAVRAHGRIAEWKWQVKERRLHPPVRDHPALEDYNNFWVDSRPYDAEGVPDD